MERDEPAAVAFGATLTAVPEEAAAPALVDEEGLAALGLGDPGPDGIRTLLGVPLVGAGGTVGVFEVGARRARRFSRDDLKLLELAAERAGHAIHNARLYERAQSNAEELEQRLVATLKRQQAEAAHAAQERGRLLAHVVAAQEDERKRIALDVHDDYLQSFAAVRMQLERLGEEIGDPGQRERAARIVRDVAATTERMRSLVFDLRPPALDWAGIASALRLYLDETLEQWGLHYRLESRLREEPPGEVRVILYRIAQEAITNVRKHARAGEVVVTLAERDGGVLVTVSDDGAGIAQPVEDATARRRHFGVASMRERAQAAGGWWRLESSPGEGTTVEFWVPAPGPAEP
jgi:signal transduction histidine kinase